MGRELPKHGQMKGGGGSYLNKGKLPKQGQMEGRELPKHGQLQGGGGSCLNMGRWRGRELPKQGQMYGRGGSCLNKGRCREGSYLNMGRRGGSYLNKGREGESCLNKGRWQMWGGGGSYLNKGRWCYLNNGRYVGRGRELPKQWQMKGGEGEGATYAPYI
ncbi:hypothetical protein DPMN_048945 [Dreissena polymorpha]|uniref:Uncharacterized protein n=1 Tax=Dreissena polymorpha TaxID=45954 RepID=A0A9D4I2U8_DREPO|nr:hypothetical protein DPMN_048945 [Dreissena polymorpha]